jgi:hypothetical protein
MAVVSMRLNRDEEDMVNFLSDFYGQDRSTLIKFSLKELYEDIIDRKTISQYEKKEKEGKTSFASSDEILKMLNIVN